MKKHVFFLNAVVPIAVYQLLCSPQLAQAKYIGQDPPKCPVCSCGSVVNGVIAGPGSECK